MILEIMVSHPQLPSNITRDSELIVEERPTIGATPE